MNPQLLEILRTKSNDNKVDYPTFIETALYTPELGYYMQNKQRIGREKDADFYTAESLGSLFYALIFDHASSVLGEEIQDYTLTELAPDSHIGPQNHPFKAYKKIGPSDNWEFEDKTFLFANELLDALPFHRFIFKNGQWLERGVELSNPLKDITLGPTSLELSNSAPEGCELDISLKAVEKLQEIIDKSKNIYLVFFDYGHFLSELIEYFPQGTARGYHKHQLINDILKYPGEMDITCHVTWDPLIQLLKKNHFKDVQLQSQEAFFVKQCGKKVQEIIEIGSFKEKRTLMELLHPTHMGQKFQALSAYKHF